MLIKLSNYAFVQSDLMHVGKQKSPYFFIYTEISLYLVQRIYFREF